MKKYLILVKHSLPRIDENVPACEWHLSEGGRLRAKRLAKRLIAYRPEILISSVEIKAQETAKVIAALHNLDVHVFADLHEHDRRGVPYLSKAEFENAVYEFFRNPGSLVFGNETANQSSDRFVRAMNSILETYENKTMLVVSHGTVISLFVSRLLGVSDYSLWKQLGLPSFIVLDMMSKSLIAQENIL